VQVIRDGLTKHHQFFNGRPRAGGSLIRDLDISHEFFDAFTWLFAAITGDPSTLLPNGTNVSEGIVAIDCRQPAAIKIPRWPIA
jgi:hypothetical protein